MSIINNADGKIWLALKGRLSLWTECPIQYPMVAYEPEATDSFLIIQHVTTEYGGPIPINVKCGQPLSGFLNISVIAPTKWSYDQLVGRAGRVADHFPNDSTYKYSDICVRIFGRSRINGAVTLNTPWNRIEVQVPFIAWG